MIRVALTGATGFIGRRVLAFLKGMENLETVCLGRDEGVLRALGTTYVVHDIGQKRQGLYTELGEPDLLIHLAWEGLPHYGESFHVEKNLPENIAFLKGLIDEGLPGLTVAGTCFEYGRQNGCLSETNPTEPNTYYGLAKDALRRFLEMYLRLRAVRFRWARLFFVMGQGQSSGSLLPLVDRALDSGAESFDMTLGEQLRDYLPVEQMAALIAKVALQGRCDGIINICSGQPVSIRRLVELHLANRSRQINLNLGAIPYSEWEPPAFWGDTAKLKKAVQDYEEEFEHG
jgi:dTDP-6-deoxy-L-talose 4-dehydrogenase (NAD+)